MAQIPNGAALRFRDDALLCTFYASGALALSSFGDDLWAVAPVVAASASAGAALVFLFLHLLWRGRRRGKTRQLAKSGRSAASRRSSERRKDGEVGQLSLTAAAQTPLPRIADVETSLQPIVSLFDGRTRHFLASFSFFDTHGSRLASEDLASLDDVIAAETMKLADLALLVESLGAGFSRTRIFCSVSKRALLSEGFRADILSFVKDYPDFIRSLALCVDEKVKSSREVAAWLKHLNNAGCSICIKVSDQEGLLSEDVGSVRMVPAELSYSSSAADAVASVQKRGQSIIAVGVSRPTEKSRLTSLGISLAAGDCFGSPRPVRPQAPMRAAA